MTYNDTIATKLHHVCYNVMTHNDTIATKLHHVCYNVMTHNDTNKMFTVHYTPASHEHNRRH